METIKIKPQTVILFVGPANCGKTTFAETVLIPQLRNKNRFINKSLNIHHLSSDQFRNDLLGNPYVYPNDVRLDFVSEQAFLMLKTKLSAVTSYPVNADFVIVDTTGMSENFRKEIVYITYKANYSLQLIVFDYKNRNDYYKNIKDSDQLMVKTVSDSIKRFKDRLSELTKKDYPNQTRVKGVDFKDITIEIDGYDEYCEYFLDSTLDYLVIGDVHGCLDELIELLCLNGFVFDKHNYVCEMGLSREGNPLKIVFMGDILDKGEQIKETIEFVDYLVSEGYAIMLKGNHENFVYNYLKGVKAYTDLGEEFINSFIQSVDILEKNDMLREQFFALFEKSKDFYISDRFILTHAPCKTEFLGKIKSGCLKKQRNFRFARRRDFNSEEEFTLNAEKEMGFMKDESRYNNPYHVVGHVMLPNVVQFNNKYMIDTGCVAGGKLTSLEFGQSGPPRIKSVKSKRTPTGEIFPLFTGPKKFEISELDPKEQTRIKYLCLDKINFISGTMAPADKDQNINVLESLNQGILYYKNAGVKRVILQPKYMGSRGNVYLFKDIAQCYVVSRNGYKLKDATMIELRPSLEILINTMFSIDEYKTAKLIILDAEILPWNLIGGGLITQHFKPVALAVQSETDELIKHGFESILEEIKSSDEYQQYFGEYKTLTKDLLTEKYGHTKERTYRNLVEYKHLDLDLENKFGSVFSNQMETHGGNNSPDIQPFAILKVVFEDDTEKLFENESNIEMFNQISNRPYAVLDFDENNDARIKYPELFVGENDQYLCRVYISGSKFNCGNNTAQGFFNYITQNMSMEGLVIKPEKVYTPGIAPYIKVRNEDYLTIVYGHNYKFSNKFQKLIKKKGVKKKLMTSIKEYELGMKMLRTPYSQITSDNADYKQLLAQMIIEVEKEKQLDPRL